MSGSYSVLRVAGTLGQSRHQKGHPGAHGGNVCGSWYSGAITGRVGSADAGATNAITSSPMDAGGDAYDLENIQTFYAVHLPLG